PGCPPTSPPPRWCGRRGSGRRRRSGRPASLNWRGPNMGHTAEANGTAAAAPAAVVARWLSLLIEPGGVTELRAIEHRPRQDDGWTETVAGFFDVAHLPDMAARALQLDRKSEGVYFPLNPLVPEILARRMNRAAPVKEKKPITAADKDVTRRRWLLIDVDPSRLSGVSSTDAEKAVAQERIELIR